VYLAIVGLVAGPDDAGRQLDAQLLIDALWAAAGRGGPFEHISAVTGPGVLDAGFYVRADSQEAADRMARDLLEHAASTAALLRGWRIRPPPGGRRAEA
jgi:hypothetical protein